MMPVASDLRALCALLAVLALLAPGGVARGQGAPNASAQGGRPPCPAGWSSYQSREFGLQAYVPPGFTVRMVGGAMLLVERASGPPASAFIVPFRPRTRVTALDLAAMFARFVASCEPRFQAQPVGQPTAFSATAAFATVAGNQAMEGRYVTVLAAGGSMAYVIGVQAAQGHLAAELPLLNAVARGFAFCKPEVKWATVRSSGGSFTIRMPQGWTLETTEGKIAKSDIDWAAYDPRNPAARAFSISPKFCSQGLAQQPLYQVRGYKVGIFQSPQQAAQGAMATMIPQVRLTAIEQNAGLTQLAQQLIGAAAQGLQQVGAGQLTIGVYDCQAQGNYNGTPLQLAFQTTVVQLVLAGGYTGNLIQQDIYCRGWLATPDQFAAATPVLDMVQRSMEYTPEYIKAVYKAEGQRSQYIRDTYRKMAQIDQEIQRSHWETQSAIAEMYSDLWSDRGAYVNEATGQIEKTDSGDLVRNSHGEVVSRRDIENGIAPDNATVLREAGTADYMSGVYDRVNFVH